MGLAPRITLAVAALAVLALAAPSGAAALTCGQNVGHSIKLTADLDCSASTAGGLNVNGRGLTINLNHHTITGPGRRGREIGVFDGSGANGITVENGTVTNFYEDLDFEHMSGAKILNVRAGYSGARGSHIGIDINDSKNGLIKNSTVSNAAQYGFYLAENDNVNVSRSKVVNSHPASTYGMRDTDSLSRIDHVTANNALTGFLIEDPNPGPLKFYNNTANGNTEDGIYIFYDIAGFQPRPRVVGNVANNNGEFGIYSDFSARGNNRAHGNAKRNCVAVTCNNRPAS